uniref:Uncharacterized protein n=1 Tax=Panagrolaimus sp. JU765 TaxID=591449 RepID=A0AC34RBB3_9BILA
MSQEKEFLGSVGCLACELGYSSLCDHLEKKGFLIDERAKNLLELKNHMNWMKKQDLVQVKDLPMITAKIVEIANFLSKEFEATEAADEVLTFTFRAKHMDLLAILNMPKTGSFLLVLANAVDEHFPEEFHSSRAETMKTLKDSRDFWMKLIDSESCLEAYLANDHQNHFKRLKDSMISVFHEFCNKAFQWLHQKYLTKSQLMNSQLWKHFEQFSESESDEESEMINFVNFLEFRISEKSKIPVDVIVIDD